jgi:dUTP pyrophosphatase
MENDIILSTDNNAWDMHDTGQVIPAMNELIIEPLHDDVQIPLYATEGDSGMDVYSREDFVLEPSKTHLFKLGFKMQIPRHPFHELGYRWEAQVRPRSSVSMKTMLRVSNSTGTVDNFYVNEVGVLLTNTAPSVFGLDYDRESFRDSEGHTSSALTSVSLDEQTDHELTGIDGNYVLTDELLKLGVKEYTWDRFPKNSILIRKGERIAQLVFAEVVRPLEIKIGKVDTSVDRGGGFGSSGTK